MSSETRDWLSTNTLIGFTDKRGNAWHHREGDQNHYAGAIPVGDVEKRLFDWTADERPIYVGDYNPDLARRDAVQLGAFAPTRHAVPGRKAIVRSDTGEVLGIFRDGYQPHQYGEWLVQNVANILDDNLAIGSAGLLQGGAVAWVSVEVPETIVTPEGVAFRPNLMAVTSFNGSIATTYKPVVTNVVCDNTMFAGLREQGAVFKVRHSSKSMGKLAEARDALGIVHSIGDDFAAEVRGLCDTKFTSREFEELVADLAPLPKGKDSSARAVSIAEKKRGDLYGLWNADSRVLPWKGTAYGAWQAVNTYQHHLSSVRGGSKTRVERNMLRAIEGKTASADLDTLAAIEKVTAARRRVVTCG